MTLDDYRNQQDPQPQTSVKVSYNDKGVSMSYLWDIEICITIEINGKFFNYMATPGKSGNMYYYNNKTGEKMNCCFVLSEDTLQYIKSFTVLHKLEVLK